MLLVAPGPGDRDPPHARLVAQADQHAPVAGGEVTASALDEPGQPPVAHFHNHPGPGHVPVLPPDQLDAQPVMVGDVASARVVTEQDGRTVQMGDDQVGPAIVVEVADGQPPAAVWHLEVISPLLGDDRKPPGPEVPQQDRPLLDRARVG